MARVLWISDAGWNSGFSQVTHQIGERLIEDYRHDVSVLAVGYNAEDPPTSPLRLYRASAGPAGHPMGFDRVIEVFAWTEGAFAFYRGITNRRESFPLGLDTFEILGAGVVSMPAALLERRFDPLGDLRPVSSGRGRVVPEAFKIGPTPREVLEMLDGERTVRAWLAQFGDPDERLTFLRALYLLVETDLAELD